MRKQAGMKHRLITRCCIHKYIAVDIYVLHSLHVEMKNPIYMLHRCVISALSVSNVRHGLQRPPYLQKSVLHYTWAK